MLCPVEHRSAAAATVAQMSGNPADADPSFFSREVGVVGQPVVTYYFAHSRIREGVLGMFPALQQTFPGAIYYVTQHDDDPAGTSRMSALAWLESLGLEFKDVQEINLDEQ